MSLELLILLVWRVIGLAARHRLRKGINRWTVGALVTYAGSEGRCDHCLYSVYRPIEI